MYNQNMQQAKKKNVFQSALIFAIIGALLIIAGGTANTIHRNISLGRTIQTLEEDLKESKQFFSSDEQNKKDEIYIKEVREPNLNNAKTAQIYNVIGLILSVISVGGLITFVLLRNKKLFITGYYFSMGCLVLTAGIFYEVFSGTFINFYENENNYMYAIAVYGKTAIFVHPLLRLLYITLILAGWIMIFVAFRNAKKNADTIIAEAQQAKQMKMQQAQMQQQFIQPQYQQAPQQYAQPTQQQFIQPQYQQAPQQVQPSQTENRQQ